VTEPAPDPWASLKAANRERTAAMNHPDPEPEEQLVATFKVTLSAMTDVERYELAGFLDETAARAGTGGLADGDNTPDWIRAFLQVPRDMALAVRAANDGGPIPLAVGVPLNRPAREKLHGVFKVARNRAQGNWTSYAAPGVGAAVVQIAAAFEVFVYGRDGEPPEEPERRRHEPPGMLEPAIPVTSSLTGPF